ncbi:MAG: 16S rRNA (cytosine(1402)-N(4))-methyltransferase RsmH [Gammaproteobacteria bacterium]
MTENFLHQPVMLSQVMTGLNVCAEGCYVDATFGRGGHSRAILNGLGAEGRLLVLDRDAQAIAAAQVLAQEDQRLIPVHCSFAGLESAVREQGWFERVDGVLLDLGVSSPQLDDPQRGFSFLRNGPLDMRMDTHSGLDAASWLATAEEYDITHVLKVFGEERFARRIARKLVEVRAETPITTTHQLAELIATAVPFKEKHKHPATRSFQAIRIFINQELEELKQVLPQVVNCLAPAGRMAVLSFHSLEDRIVKRFIRDEQRGPQLPPDLPIIPDEYRPRLRAVGKMSKATNEEVQQNPRARSAVLRIAERGA